MALHPGAWTSRGFGLPPDAAAAYHLGAAPMMFMEPSHGQKPPGTWAPGSSGAALDPAAYLSTAPYSDVAQDCADGHMWRCPVCRRPGMGPPPPPPPPPVEPPNFPAGAEHLPFANGVMQKAPSRSMPEWAAAAEAAAASGQNCAVEGPTWWALVWCHEKCHKNDVKPVRNTLAKAAVEAGAELKCLSKGTKFDMWVNTPLQPPFVLLTDWREIKPCIEIIDKHPDGIKPLFTVVLAEDEKLYRRSTNWLKNLAERPDPVHIYQNFGLAWLFIIEQMTEVCAEKQQGGWAPAAPPVMPPLPAFKLLDRERIAQCYREVPAEAASEPEGEARKAPAAEEEAPKQPAAEPEVDALSEPTTESEEEAQREPTSESEEEAPREPAPGSEEEPQKEPSTESNKELPRKPASESEDEEDEEEDEDEEQEEQQQSQRLLEKLLRA